MLRIFIALKNPSPWPGFETATFGSSGQHTNHYTSKATNIFFNPSYLALSALDIESSALVLRKCFHRS
jgi:hypothetical protein